VIEALDLSDIYGIGHSAGATDLLLAAKLLPERFQRLFVMEPTIMDSRALRTGHGGMLHPFIKPTLHSAKWLRAICRLEYRLFARQESGRPSG